MILLFLEVASADEFDAVELGKPPAGPEWNCPPGGSSCFKEDRVASLRGVWTVTLNGDGAVETATFSAFWTPFSLPVRPGQPPIQTTHTPLADARAAAQRLAGKWLSWDVVAREPSFPSQAGAGEPSVRVYERGGEHRTLAVWETPLTDEQGEVHLAAGLHVQRSDR